MTRYTAPSKIHAPFCNPRKAVPRKTARTPNAPMKTARVAANSAVSASFRAASLRSRYLMKMRLDPIEQG
jgi:hypothetical protein